MPTYLLLVFLSCVTLTGYSQTIPLFIDQTVPEIMFAGAEIEMALRQRGFSADIRSLTDMESPLPTPSLIITTQDNLAAVPGTDSAPSLEAEGFRLRVRQPEGVTVIGADAAGAMYGGLELAEQIKLYGLDQVKNTTQSPYMNMRGTKFNIPLDARTPSYSDVSDAAQNNMAEMWSWDFWTNYIDNLARYRYNFVSLWSLHPFPSLVQLEDYPDIALDDVMRSKGPFKENYTLQGRDFDAPEIMNHLETIKSITIDEKIDFWRRVMRYGKERNVDFYIITWNIFTYGTQNQYGITDDIDNPTTVDYFRKSVQALVETYPDLKGIGLTTGENMHDASFAEKEAWAYNTYAQGVMDAIENEPGRKITFVHRQHQTGALDIADRFKPLIDHPDINFIFSFKYAKAHVYSSTEQPYHPEFVEDIQTRGNLKTIWTLRNDDIYYFRWGAPDFVREFIQNIPYDVSEGYYYGSDQYIWGREFMSRFPESPRQLEIEKHWYHWLLWGRLGYNPALNNDRLVDILQARFPEVSGQQLFEAWQHASMIYPTTTGFHWGPLDFHWYIEGNQSRAFPHTTPYKFNDINYFIQLPPHPLSGNISIPEFVNARSDEQQTQGTTPYQVADQLNQYASEALAAVEPMDAAGNFELFKTLTDIKIIAYLGHYYGHKIQAATDIAFFRNTGELPYREKAIRSLQQAALYWKKYTSEAKLMYHNPLWTNRVGYVDWETNYIYALHDLELIGADEKLPPQDLLPGGMVLEAEAAKRTGGKLETTISHFQGAGYVSKADQLNWTVDIPAAGLYRLQYRYARRGGTENTIPLLVDGQEVAQLTFGYTGESSNWTVDQVALELTAGQHPLQLGQLGPILLDQISISPLGLAPTRSN